MKSHIVFAGVVLIALGTASALAQTVDQLVANHALLNAELDRCKKLGMASIDDARCKTAWTAENKRFFGNGQTTYTPGPVTVTPGQPVPDISPPKQPGPPHE